LKLAGSLRTDTRSSPPLARPVERAPDDPEADGGALQPASASASNSVNGALNVRERLESPVESWLVGQKSGRSELCATDAAEMDFACKID
jgi:hypothetical protein